MNLKNTRRYQIFISSTYKDLVEEREAVIKAILQNYHFPIGMEMFHADDQKQWVQIEHTIEMSDFYVLILGTCCGTLLNDSDISYTEKEYDFAKSCGIPVLSFIVDPNALTKHFEENGKQRKAYKKFKEKVEKLPRMVWSNKTDLALNVITTLHAKIAENTHKGWVQYSSVGFFPENRISDHMAGEYNVVYYSAIDGGLKKVNSFLKISPNNEAKFLNNVKELESDNFEYSYKGICESVDSILYVHLKNDASHERVTLSLINPVGLLDRYIGILSGLTSNNIPACVKIACFKDTVFHKVNFDKLQKILTKTNSLYEKHAFIIEEEAKLLFYSDNLLD